MGDNRDVSYDSRQPKHGPVYLSAESGKPPVHYLVAGAPSYSQNNSLIA
jgi:hypothetical protein